MLVVMKWVQITISIFHEHKIDETEERKKKEKRKKERNGKDEEELVNDISFLFIFSTFWVLVFQRRKVLGVEDCEREREAK